MSEGELIFIGLGLYDDESLSLEALQACKEADILVAEQYTSILAPGSMEKLSKKLGKEIIVFGRNEVEKGKVLEKGKSKIIGFLVPGDPMTATTHADLRMRAHRAGIKTRIVHGTSAMVAIPGILGLQHYKFGRTITIPFPEKGFEPTSPLELLLENLSHGLHTLALLDIRVDEGRLMTANQGLHWLLATAKKCHTSAINDETVACVVARAGSRDCLAKANRIKHLLKMDFGRPLHSIVVPGRLHFLEEEALVRFAGAPESLFPAK